jgi:cell division transport system ATP-binding protein
MNLFRRFNQVGTTVLIASHDLDLIGQMGMPVISLNKGRISHNGLPFNADSLSPAADSHRHARGKS